VRFFLTVCLLCTVLMWFSPAASAGQLFYDFSGPNVNVLTSIDTSTGAVTTIGTVSGYQNLSSSAFGPDGTFYAIGDTTAGAPKLITVDLHTAAVTVVGAAPASAFGLEIANDGTIYTTEGSYLWKGSSIGSLTKSTQPLGFSNFMDFAFDPQGNLYAVASPYNIPPTGTSSIYQINTSTGAGGTSPVATVSVPCLMGIAFDNSDNLFATEFCGGPYPLYEINLGTGGSTVVGPNNLVSNFHGGDIYNTPEPASLMLCLLGGALLAARGLRRAG
jgi:hypothetical protein